MEQRCAAAFEEALLDVKNASDEEEALLKMKHALERVREVAQEEALLSKKEVGLALKTHMAFLMQTFWEVEDTKIHCNLFVLRHRPNQVCYSSRFCMVCRMLLTGALQCL